MMNNSFASAMHQVQPAIRFHQFRPNENYKTVAERYNVDENQLREQNPGIEGQTGEIVVILLK